VRALAAAALDPLERPESAGRLVGRQLRVAVLDEVLHGVAERGRGRWPGLEQFGRHRWTSTGRRVWLIMSRLAGLPPRNHPWLITHAEAGMLGLLVTNGAS